MNTLAAHLSSEPWGTLPGGDAVRLYTLRNAQGMKVMVSDLGATLVSWLAPDRAGRLADILLGHDTPAGYLAATTYMGGLIGRWANRIAGARFTLDGIDYALDRNENGNLLHGGANGFHRQLWQADEDRGSLVLRLDSPEGDGGFPGNVSVQVRYTLDDDGTLTIEYEGVTDAPTPLNLTSHGYFNLSGEASPDIRGHVLTIDADAFLEVDPQLTPYRIADVSGSAFDFRHGAPLGARLDERPWLGRRPCTPDMMPIIGPAKRHKDLWFAFGHAHHGLTLGPVTGRLLAEMMTGAATVTDPHPFRADRF